ncbi:CU044_2847 family protein [Streptomyces olivoreticuli]|uniref:CU044_2847 family protein n=1 Tax=Streptomyces olivoreticuli TaxID=68246 RepID=UPI0013C32162|nr:CU044_2847 family protein [Streptomyces olivoreticuli]
MSDGITQVRLDDGTVVWARISEAQELDRPGDRAGGYAGGYEDSSAGGAARRVAGLAGGLTDVVRGVVGSLRPALAAVAPQEVTVEFGIELSAKAGHVISLLADGEGKASITVSLTWSERGEPPPATAEPPATPSAP